MKQNWITAAYYRGGTSKGVFFQAKDLPTNSEEALSKIFLKVIGSPDPNGRQLNGMGGGVSSVSKCVIISPSKREDADIDYNFIQLAVEEPVAEWNNNCGNLSGAVGPYAVNTRIIKPQEGENKIRIYQVNTDKIIHSTFDVKDGIALTEGDYSIAGVSGTASKVRLDYLSPGGSGTGKLLPTGNVIDEIDIGKITIGQEVTLKVSAYRDKKFVGIVSKIEPMSKIDQNVTTFPVLIDIENKDNLLLIGMNTDVEIEILNEEVALALPAGSLRTRKDIRSVAQLLGINELELNNFLANKVEGENFDSFIVLKKTSKGVKLAWVKTGKTDLNYVEVKEGVNNKEIVYVLPSEGLIKYQQRFSERIKSRFG